MTLIPPFSHPWLAYLSPEPYMLISWFLVCAWHIDGLFPGLWFSFGGHKKGRGSGRTLGQIQHHPVWGAGQGVAGRTGRGGQLHLTPPRLSGPSVPLSFPLALHGMRERCIWEAHSLRPPHCAHSASRQRCGCLTSHSVSWSASHLCGSRFPACVCWGIKEIDGGGGKAFVF